MNGPPSAALSWMMEAATETLGFSMRKHQDWFDDSLPQIRSLLHEKNVAHDASLRNPDSASLRWQELRSKVQRELRLMENNWWTEKAVEIQRLADLNDTQRFY